MRRLCERCSVTGADICRAQVKKSWQAMDAIDESWCPVVQVHGLLMEPHGLSGRRPRVGLLMERYGVSLYDLLHDRAALELSHAKKGGLQPLPVFDNACKRTVALNVASACRYLHDVGMLHRDLKDQNVLVDPENGFRCVCGVCSGGCAPCAPLSYSSVQSRTWSHMVS